MNARIAIITAIGLLAAAAAGAQADLKVRGRYGVGFTRTPFTPRAVEPVTLTFTFVDSAEGERIKEPVGADIRIRRAGETDDLLVRDDVIATDATYTVIHSFAEPGLYDVDVDFWLESAPDATATDTLPYVIEVLPADTAGSPPREQPPAPEAPGPAPYAPLVPGIAFVLGLLAGAALRSSAPWSCRGRS